MITRRNLLAGVALVLVAGAFAWLLIPALSVVTP